MNFRPIHAILIGVVTLFLCFPFFAPLYYVDLLTKVLILSIFAAAVNLLMGYTGLPSMGHAAFLGMASYVVGILTTHGYQNFWSNALLGIASATLLAAFFGLICVHMGGIRFVLITLALGQVVWGFAVKLRQITMVKMELGESNDLLANCFGPWMESPHFYYFVLPVIVFYAPYPIPDRQIPLWTLFAGNPRG